MNFTIIFFLCVLKDKHLLKVNAFSTGNFWRQYIIVNILFMRLQTEIHCFVAVVDKALSSWKFTFAVKILTIELQQDTTSHDFPNGHRGSLGNCNRKISLYLLFIYRWRTPKSLYIGPQNEQIATNYKRFSCWCAIKQLEPFLYVKRKNIE